MGLEDDTVLVTGARQGIGEATAARCGPSGAHAVLTDVNTDTGPETADRVADEHPGTVAFHELDVTDADEAFFAAFAELSLVVVPPLVYDAAGRVRVTVVGRGESLGELVEALREGAGVGVEVLEIGSYDRRHGTVTAGLTDRQRAAVATATAMGYYAVPREASLASVAEELDVATGTASELLRRAEATLMGTLFGSPTSR